MKDNSKNVRVEKWIEKSLDDFDTASKNFDIGKLDVTAFYLQQSLEKMLKALYLKKFKRLIKVHDLKFLAEELGLPKFVVRVCEEVTPYYVESRYPDMMVEFTKNDMKKSMRKVKMVIEWLRRKI